MNYEQHRDDFERAYAERYQIPPSVMSLYRRVDGYSIFSIDAAWWAYQTALDVVAKQAAPVAQLSEPPVPKTIKVTEEMHRAAAKVLYRASGMAGIGQLLMDAMLAAAPTTPKE